MHTLETALSAVERVGCMHTLEAARGSRAGCVRRCTWHLAPCATLRWRTNWQVAKGRQQKAQQQSSSGPQQEGAMP